MKNPAHLYEVSFFSALWMVFPESWKRRVADFYAHDCIYIFSRENSQHSESSNGPRRGLDLIALEFFNLFFIWLEFVIAKLGYLLPIYVSS